MINTNTTPTEHTKNVKDYIELTSSIIFENQEKIPNGEYVEMCRMMREMTTHTPPPDNNDIQRELTDTQNQHLLAMDNYNQANERVIDLQLDLQQANEQIARMLQEHKKYRERRKQEIQQLTRSRDILHSIVVNRKKK
tara:strand:- start:74 stop:487 length:414 start_codon:yes stop_codon:yes gene_type:complete